MRTLHFWKHRHYFLCQSSAKTREQEPDFPGSCNQRSENEQESVEELEHLEHLWWLQAQTKHLHFLSNGGVFLEEQIHVDVKVTRGDAPGHTAHHLGATLGHTEVSERHMLT